MAHFVNNPPDKINLTAIRELNLYNDNGTAAVCVWGMPKNKGSELRTQGANLTFAGEFYKAEGNFSYYMCRGLVPNDEIAAFFYESDTDVRQHTSWLPVRKVSAYRPKPVPSAYKSTILLDPYGSEQRQPPIAGKNWIAGVDNTIKKLLSHPLGQIILGLVGAAPFTIKPHLGTQFNASTYGSEVAFTPQICTGNEPGNQADEVLFHELVHLLEFRNGGNTQGYIDPPSELDPGSAGPPNAVPNCTWGAENADFLSVTATNLYSAMLSRTLRHDYKDKHPNPMQDRYLSDPARFRREQAANFVTATNRVPLFIAALAASGASWNPFVAIPIPPLIPGPSIPTVPHPLVPRRNQPVLPTPVPPSAPGTAIQNLSWGSKGADVSRAQTALNNQLRPSPQLVTDGDFGNLTLRAVQAFQRQAKLDPDGVIGPYTRAALGI